MAFLLALRANRVQDTGNRGEAVSGAARCLSESESGGGCGGIDLGDVGPRKAGAEFSARKRSKKASDLKPEAVKDSGDNLLSRLEALSSALGA